MEKQIFQNLKDEERKAINNFYKRIELLVKFQNKATPKLFKFLFEEKGEHLWEVFVLKSNRQILDFFNRVDLETKELVLTNIYMFSEDHYPSEPNKLYLNC